MINKIIQYVKQHKKVQIQILFVLIGILYASVFLFSKDFNNHDTFFNYLRIREVGEELIHLHIPSFTIYTNEVLGGATNYYYPYLFFIPSALLSVFLKGTQILALVMFIGMYGGLNIAYYAIRTINHQWQFDFTFAILYCFSVYIFAFGYAQGDLGSLYAFFVAPIAFIGYYKWIKQSKWLMLSIGITLMIYCNEASVTCITLAFIVMTILEIKQLTLNKIINGVKAIIVTVLLTMMYWLPAIFLFSQNKIYFPSQTTFPLYMTQALIFSPLNHYFVPQLCNVWGMIDFLGLLVYIFDWKFLYNIEHKIGLIGISIYIMNVRPIAIWLLSNTFLTHLQYLHRFSFISHFIFALLLTQYLIYKLPKQVSNVHYKSLLRILGAWLLIVMSWGVFMQTLINNQISTSSYKPHTCKTMHTTIKEQNSFKTIYNQQLNNSKILHGLPINYIDYYPSRVTVNKCEDIHFRWLPRFNEYTRTNELNYSSKNNKYHQILMTTFHGQIYHFKDNNQKVHYKIKNHMVHIKMHKSMNRIKIFTPTMWYQYIGLIGSLIGLIFIDYKVKRDKK